MGSTRRRFTDEYKQHAVRLVLDSGDSIAEIARSIGVHEMTLGKWVKKHATTARNRLGRSMRTSERNSNASAKKSAGYAWRPSSQKKWRPGCVLNDLRSECRCSSVAGRCCVRDGGRPAVVAVQAAAANHRELRRSRAGVVSVTEKARRERVRCGSRASAKFGFDFLTCGDAARHAGDGGLLGGH